MILALIIALIILSGIFFYYQNNKLDETFYKITNSEYGEAMRILHLSDFHSKAFNNVLKKAKSLKPDIICITGDYINDKCKNKDKMINYAKELVQIAPVYYITGNHERRLDNFSDIMQQLKDVGFTVLLDEIIDTQVCSILGLDENQADFKDYKARKNGTFKYSDKSELFHRLEEKEKFKLVLSHFPENFEGVKELNYSQYNFDLQLSGHAHGGQWIIFKPLFSPGQGILPKYAKGSFGTKPKLIISRGLGNSEFPLRLFNHPEIVIIDINK